MYVSRVVGRRRSEVAEVPDLVARPGYLVVDVLAAGVCTSDLPPWRSWGSADNPVHLGHEIVGRVRDVAGAVSAFRVGVVVTGLGDGGFATQALLEERTSVPVPQGIEPALCLGEPFADLVAAIGAAPRRQPGPVGDPGVPGERIAVVGAGFMGLGLVQLARLRAPELLVAIDPSPVARERALAQGADVAYAPDAVPEVLRDGPPAAGSGSAGEAHPVAADGRMDLVLEAAGVAGALPLSVAMAKPFSTVSIVGYHHYTDELVLPMDAWYKGLTIRNGFAPNRDVLMSALVRAVDLIGQRRITQAPLVTHRFGLDGADEAFALMESRPDSYVKSILEPAA